MGCSFVFGTVTGSPVGAAGLGCIYCRAIEAVHWRDGISVESGLPNWISLKVSCGFVTAERLIHFMSEYRRDLPEDDRDNLMLAFREMLMNAMEHGAGFDPEKVVRSALFIPTRYIYSKLLDLAPKAQVIGVFRGS